MTSQPFHETLSTGPAAATAQKMQALVPVLETERMILRAPQITDFDTFADMLAPPRGKFYGDCQTREDAWGEFMQLNATWLLRGYGAWALTDRSTGEVLGFVQIGAEPGDWEPELGWVVSKSAEGKGFAAEAARAVRAYAFGTLHLPSLVSYIDEENAPSIRLAKRLGATRDADAEGHLTEEDACFVFRHHPKGAA
ncbi:MAG: GNAT family N-acetyltransferase [Pseudomonadota bacterium]